MALSVLFYYHLRKAPTTFKVTLNIFNECTISKTLFHPQRLSKTTLSTSLIFQALTETDCERKVQDQFGIEYKKTEDSFVIFEAQLLNPSAVVMSIILLLFYCNHFKYQPHLIIHHFSNVRKHHQNRNILLRKKMLKCK